MNAVNAVRLFILVSAFSAFCRAADKDFSVNCEDVTGIVGEEVNFSCSVSIHSSGCCIVKYKFLYPEKYKKSEICKVFPGGSCEERNRFTCSFRSKTEMMETFRFFVQTQCGIKTTGFTVNITESNKPVIVTEAPTKKESSTPVIVTKAPDPRYWDMSGEHKADMSDAHKAEGRGFKVAVIAAAVSCFIIVIVPIIYKLKLHYTQRRNCFHDISESRPENMI